MESFIHQSRILERRQENIFDHDPPHPPPPPPLFVLPFLPAVRELPPSFGVPSLALARKTPKAALRESPSLRNIFKPITQKFPGLTGTPTALLRMQFGMEGQESTSSTQEAEKAKSASLPAYAQQTTKMKQKPRKQQQPTVKSALILLTVLSSLRTPCPPCRPFSQIGTLNSATYLLRLPPIAEAMQSPCSGFPPTATCLAMRLLTLWQRRGTTKEQVDRSTNYAKVKTILKVKQHSKWRLEHPRYNKADPYFLLTRREQVTVSGSGQATTASTITCILNSASAIQSSALTVLAIRQQNFCCSPAPSMSYSERESDQTTKALR